MANGGITRLNKSADLRKC